VSEAWVVNASPIILFSRVSRLDLIERLAPAIIVPNAVIEEVRAGQHRDRTAARALEWAGKHRTVSSWSECWRASASNAATRGRGMSAIVESLLRDIRVTGRLLAVRPGWTAAAVLCLAIATGANTAAFSLVNGLLLRPLPFDQPNQLVMVALRERLKTGTRPFALREYRELSSQAGDIGSFLARTFFPLSLSADDGAQMTQVELVSGNYFETLRVKPFAGQFFNASADRPGGELQGVLSYAVWRRRFGADPSVIGRSMRVNGRPMVVAGIAPPGFVGAMQLVAADLWLPAAVYPDLAGSADADAAPMFGVMARLAPNVTADRAEARLTSIAAALAHASRAASVQAVIVTPATGFGVPPAIQGAVLTLSGFIYLLMALLMAVACANVAALVLARGTGRTQEIAVRLSLGASRLHIARQLITESIVLAIVGCGVGAVVALWLTQALVARVSTPFQYVSYAIDVHPDARVFAYCALVTLVSAVACGIAPIRHAARVDVVDLLKQSAAKGGSRESRRTLNAMVVGQFAVSTMLLVGAGMLVRTYINAESAQPDYDTTGIVATTIDADQINLDRPAGVRLYQDVMERLSALPGVTDVSLTRDLPPGHGRTVTIAAEADAGSASGDSVTATEVVVSSRFFQTVGVAIRQGRAFSDAEPGQPMVAVINEAMARRLWPGGSPVGRFFTVSGRTRRTVEVIGTVPDSKEQPLSQGPRLAFYRPFPQEYSAEMTVLMRVNGATASFLSEIRETIRDLNPDLSIVDLRTVHQVFDGMSAQRRIPATVLLVVGLLGLLLSAVGLYGVVAYGVRQRAHEFGIRLALGARPSDVTVLILRQGFIIVGIGLAVGTTGAIAITQIARTALFGIGRLDAATVAIVGVVLSGAGFAALYMPAKWASRVEPAQTLRGE